MFNSKSANNEENYSTDNKKSKKGGVKSFLGSILIAFLLAMVIRAFVFQPFYIPSSSMENTLKIGDTIGVNKMSPLFFDIKKGDIVVFKDPGNWVSESNLTTSKSFLDKVIGILDITSSEDDVFVIKRVIGVGGDTVECKGEGHPILVNGKAIKEEYLKEKVASNMAFKVQVPKGRIWVMGDNRNNSADSRYHQNDEFNGTISTDAVVGKAFSIIMPFSHMQILSGTNAFEK